MTMAPPAIAPQKSVACRGQCFAQLPAALSGQRARRSANARHGRTPIPFSSAPCINLGSRALSTHVPTVSTTVAEQATTANEGAQPYLGKTAVVVGAGEAFGRRDYAQFRVLCADLSSVQLIGSFCRALAELAQSHWWPWQVFAQQAVHAF